LAAKKAREEAIQKQKEENEAREQHERQLASKKAREEAIQEQEEHEHKRQLAEEKAREEAIQKQQEQEERRRLEIEAAERKHQEEQSDWKQKEDVAATEAAAKLQLQQQKDEEDAATKQRKKLEQLEKMYSNKFKTRAALDRELKQLQELVKEAEGLCFDLEVNSKGAAAMVEYHTLVPLCDSPKFLSVAELETKITSLEQEIAKMSVGRQRAVAVQDLYEWKQWLKREHMDAASHDPNGKLLFPQSCFSLHSLMAHSLL
jgi:hypothetical protein